MFSEARNLNDMAMEMRGFGMAWANVLVFQKQPWHAHETMHMEAQLLWGRVTWGRNPCGARLFGGLKQLQGLTIRSSLEKKT